MARNRIPRTEPAHSLMYEPGVLSPAPDAADSAALLDSVTRCLENPLNDRQEEFFHIAFRSRVSLLWGPPGTGKTRVCAAVILGWLERAWEWSGHVTVGIGASNYNAIDNVLVEVLELLDRRRSVAVPPPTRVVRVRSSSAVPARDPRVENVVRDSVEGRRLASELNNPGSCVVVGGTWQQLGRMAQGVSATDSPVAQWFDLLVIDEASQVPVASAAAYFLLLKEDGHVVLAGDHRQLGPIYGFKMRDTAQGLFDCVFTYMQETHAVRPIALQRNYRTNVEISGWPRERFYSGGYDAFFPTRRLQIEVPQPAGTPPPTWPDQLAWTDAYLDILRPSRPVVVISYPPDTFTLSNPFEAQIVASLAVLYRNLLLQADRTLAGDEFWNERMGIVTPHRAQMSTLRNLLLQAAGMPMEPPPFVDTVDRFQGQERDLMIASYVVADNDFVASEEEFILDPRRFNVTLTRARSKFIMLVSDAVLQHLPGDAQVARQASHLQLFAENYCSDFMQVDLPFVDNRTVAYKRCRLRARSDPVPTE